MNPYKATAIGVAVMGILIAIIVPLTTPEPPYIAPAPKVSDVLNNHNTSLNIVQSLSQYTNDKGQAMMLEANTTTIQSLNVYWDFKRLKEYCNTDNAKFKVMAYTDLISSSARKISHANSLRGGGVEYIPQPVTYRYPEELINSLSALEYDIKNHCSKGFAKA